MATLFIDIGALSEYQTDLALEFMHKAHGDDESAWAQHESPFIRRLIELFTERGLMRLEHVRNGIDLWLSGDKHRPASDLPARPAGAMLRWTESEKQLVSVYLESLPPGEWTLEDNMLMVDYLVQRYLPADDMRTEAEWLATRANLMGRVQASMENLTVQQADDVLRALPSTVDDAVDMFTMSPRQEAVVRYGVERAAENVVRISDETRRRMRNVIMHHTGEQMVAGHGQAIKMSHDLRTVISDQFAALNRDWRRIAVTEAGENLNQGYVASKAPGTKLRRVEQYRNACAFCRRIDGRVVEVVSPDDPDKDGDTQVWVGKTNIGRSASPRKRVGNELIEREPHELYWIAAGIMHPNCRGRWIPEIEDREGDDPEFGDWLRATLGGKS